MEVLPWGKAREKGLEGQSLLGPPSSPEGEVEREELELWRSHNIFEKEEAWRISHLSVSV